MEGAMVRPPAERDLYPVSQYYSRRLVTYIRRVLQVLHHVLRVIPTTMFSLMLQKY